MNYATTKAALDAAIRTNGVQAITGAVLNTILNDILAVLGKHYQFGGLVTPDTAFTAGDEKVAFFAVEAGTYTNFGGAVLDGKTLHILTYDSAWHDTDTAIPSGAAFSAALDIALKGAQSGIAEGIADTISAGTAQEFLQRQSGGDGVNCIKRFKGCTKAINQLIRVSATSQTTQGITITISGSKIKISGTATSQTDIYITNSSISLIEGHKYMLTPDIGNVNYGLFISGSLTNYKGVFTPSGNETNCPLIRRIASGASVDEEFSYPELVDLTLAGFADYTLAQILALYPNGFGAYNAGVLKSNDAAALLTDGRNQWDEVAEVGTINQQTGENEENTSQIRSKNYINVFGSTNYYLKLEGSGIWAFFYDANLNPIADAVAGSVQQSNLMSRINDAAVFTTPVAARYMRFFCFSSYGATYKNDICINISDPSFNGTYQPYWQRVLALRLSELTGIPEGGTEADRVTMFPNGAGGAGSAFDSLFVENGVTKARRTMSENVNLGDLSWQPGSIAGLFLATITGQKLVSTGTTPNDICSKYIVGTTIASSTNAEDKKIYQGNQNYVIFFKDTTFSGYTGAQVAAALSGVFLTYELATPIVYTDLQYADGTPFTMPATILVDDFGTERIQAPEGATTPSAPFCCDSNYSIGVTNLVKRLAALENAE